MNETHSTKPERANVTRIVGVLLCVAALGLDFFSGFFPVRSSNDPWWHLKTGKVLTEYMAEHGFAFPPTDVFTLTGSDVRWINHEWLADLGLYGLYLLGGLQLCIVVKSLLLAATGLVIILTLRGEGCRLGWCAVGALLTILAAQTTLYLRPPILTYFFVVVFIWVLRNFPRSPWRFTALFTVLEILWVNLHGGALLGVVFCGFYLLDRSWKRLQIRWGLETDEEDVFVPALICFVLVGLGSLVNPWGYEIHLLPGKVLNDHWLVSRLGELAPPNLRYANGMRILLCGFLLIPFLHGKRIGLFRALTVLFLGYQAFNYMRQIPLFALVAVPVVIERLDASSRWLADRLGSVKQGLPRCAGVGLRTVDSIAVFVFFAYYLGWNPPFVQALWPRNVEDLPALLEEGYVPAGYPEGAVNFILYHRIPGPIMHNDNFAGYLIWRLSPEIMPVFTDTRFDLFGSRFAKEERAVIEVREEPEGFYRPDGQWYPMKENPTREDWRQIAELGLDPDVTAWVESGKPYWKYILDKYDINIIMVYCTHDPIDVYLRSGDHGWQAVYNRRKEGYEVFLADRPENQPIFERLGIE